MKPNSVNGMTYENIDQERLIRLSGKCKNVQAFEYEGVSYLGNAVGAVKQFIESETFPADFHVWLQNNYKHISTK